MVYGFGNRVGLLYGGILDMGRVGLRSFRQLKFSENSSGVANPIRVQFP